MKVALPTAFDEILRQLQKGKRGRTIVSVSVIQQLLPLPLVLLRAPQLPCKQAASHKAYCIYC